MTEVRALIAGLEIAKTPDRRLDGEIALVIGAKRVPLLNWLGVPHYTGSIDAALAVRPTDYHYDINDHPAVGVRVSAPGFDHVRHYYAHHPIIAISICIASLKARLAQGENR